MNTFEPEKTTGVAPPPPAAVEAAVDDRVISRVLPVIEERVDIHKRVVEASAPLRLRKTSRDHVVSVAEDLQMEEAHVERVPMDRVVAGPVQTRQAGGVTIVSVVEERAVVVKQFVLVEELHITHRRRTVPFSQQVTVRREEAVVERLDRSSGTWSRVDAEAEAEFRSTRDPPP